jgi:hypothetical protein
MNKRMIFAKDVLPKLTHHIVNGLGELIEVSFEMYIDPAYYTMFPSASLSTGFNPSTGLPWGVPQKDCYACSMTLNGGTSCRAHGVMRVERIIK